MTLHDEATELGPLALGSSEGLGPVLDAWAQDAGVRFVNRRYGQHTAETVGRDALEALLANVLKFGLQHGRWQAAEAAAKRVRNTEIVDGETPAKLREAIAQRVEDVGKPTAWPGA